MFSRTIQGKLYSCTSNDQTHETTQEINECRKLTLTTTEACEPAQEANEINCTMAAVSRVKIKGDSVHSRRRRNTATASPIGTKMIGIGPEANESNGTTSAAREAKAYRDSENTRRRRNKINIVHQSVLCGSKMAEILISHLVAELLRS